MLTQSRLIPAGHIKANLKSTYSPHKIDCVHELAEIMQRSVRNKEERQEKKKEIEKKKIGRDSLYSTFLVPIHLF